MDISKQITRSLNLFYIQLNSIRNFLSASKARNYSESNTLEFVHCLDNRLDEIEKEVQSFIESVLDAETSLNQIRTFQKELPILVSDLQHIRNSEIQWLPWSMVGSIRDIASHIVPDAQILVTGTLHPSYRILPPIDEPANCLPHEKFAVVEIPFLHRRNSPLHVLVGHELFHLLAPKFIKEKNAAALNSIKKKLHEEVESKKKQVHNLFNGNEEHPDWLFKLVQQKIEGNIEDIIGESHNIWERALTEIFCDLGCLHYFGPSVMFALSDLHLIHGGTSAKGRTSHHHPEFAYRLFILSKQMENVTIYKNAFDELVSELKKDSNLKPHAEAFEAQIKTIDDISKPMILQDMEPAFSAAYAIVMNDIIDIWEFLEDSTIIDTTYCWFTSIEETVHHLEKIRNSIPSGNVLVQGELSGKAGNYSAMSLASWIHIIKKYANSDNPMSENLYVADYLDDCNILLKSYDDANSILEFNKIQKEEG